MSIKDIMSKLFTPEISAPVTENAAPVTESVVPIDGAIGYAADVPIGTDQVREAWNTLRRYKQDKANLENKIVANEQWWKLRHWEQMRQEGTPHVPASAWLWNVIVSKHADTMDSFPEPNMLPRAADDRDEAKKLSSIMPVVLEHNNFRKVYSELQWYKLKQGAGVYGVFWDSSKHNGLGDISIKNIDALSLFWEGGIRDIQDSENVFFISLVGKKALEMQYPVLKDKHNYDDSFITKYRYDDTVDTSSKSAVVDWYYHGYNSEGKRVLHYCKFVGDVVLFATENEPDKYPDGWYDHGLYPFVFDTLFTIEGTPFGYGYIDVCKDAQEQIDILNHAIVKNARMAATPRYFIRGDGSVNEAEFADWTKDFVHTNGDLGENSIREINVGLMNGNYLNLIESKINELKETSGNRDVNNGGSTSGITAASAIAAMQEASGKLSRDASGMSYDAFRLVITQCIELIRQFYDIPRQFRILGDMGREKFIEYSNAGIKPIHQGYLGGADMGYRKPVFDIEVSAQKSNPYSKMSQNELALQFYNLGFFAPPNADTALACLDAMDFPRKETLMQKIQDNGTMQQKLGQLGEFALGMAKQYDPAAMGMIAQILGLGGEKTQAPIADPRLFETDALGGIKGEEHSRVANARAQAQEATQPND